MQPQHSGFYDRNGLSEWLASLAGSKVIIQTHDVPDQDAIGSALGLQAIFRHYGVDSEVCYVGEIVHCGLKFILQEYGINLNGPAARESLTQADRIVLVDGQKFNANVTDLPGLDIGCIDHHPDNQRVELPYEDIRTCGACASIIAEYFRELSLPLDERTATLLLYALETDTSFMRRGVTTLDIAAFGQLHQLADSDMLTRLGGQCISEADLRAYGAAIKTLARMGNLGLVRIPFACDDYLISLVADFILSIAEVDTAIVYSEREDGIKFSARSILPEVHCGNLLRACLAREGGYAGGHAHMAGGFVPSNKVDYLYKPGLSQRERELNSEAYCRKLATVLNKNLQGADAALDKCFRHDSDRGDQSN